MQIVRRVRKDGLGLLTLGLGFCELQQPMLWVRVLGWMLAEYNPGSLRMLTQYKPGVGTSLRALMTRKIPREEYSGRQSRCFLDSMFLFCQKKKKKSSCSLGANVAAERKQGSALLHPNQTQYKGHCYSRGMNGVTAIGLLLSLIDLSFIDFRTSTYWSSS